MFQSQLRHRTSWPLHDIGTSWRHWCVCSLVITVRHRLYRSFQSRPTSQSIMISVKYTLACRFSFFQLFPKKLQKSSPKLGSPWCSYQWLIKFKAVYFPGRQKIKCQTTGSPPAISPSQKVIIIREEGEGKEKGRTSLFCAPKMKSASQKLEGPAGTSRPKKCNQATHEPKYDLGNASSDLAKPTP